MCSHLIKLCRVFDGQAAVAARDVGAEVGEHGHGDGTQAPAGGASAERGATESGHQHALEAQILQQRGEEGGATAVAAASTTQA